MTKPITASFETRRLDALLHRALLFNHISDAVVITGLHGEITDWNTGAERMFGWSREEVLGRSCALIHAGADAEQRVADIAEEIERSGRCIWKIEFARKNGTRGRGEMVTVPLLDHDDRMLGTLSVHTENAPSAPEQALLPLPESEPVYDARIEARLRDERFLLRTLIDAVPDPIFCKDRQGRYLLHNIADQQMFGEVGGNHTGRRVFEIPGLQSHATIYHEDDMAVMSTGQPVINREEPYERPNGSKGWFLTSKFPLRDETGEIIGLVGVARDITTTKRAREDLHQAQLRLIDHVENSPLAVIEWTPDSRVTRWSGQAENVFGWSAAEIVGKRFGDWDFVHPEDLAKAEESMQRLTERADQRNVRQFRNLTKTGRIIHCEWQNSVLSDAAGRMISILSLVQDVTERARADQAGRKAAADRQALERKLQEAQKLESLGVLAGGIAHDFNNLLTGVLGNASLARIDLPPEHPIQQYLGQIELAAARAADLCKQMLAYSGKGRFVVKQINLNAVIEDTTRLLQVSISKRAVLKFQLSAGLPSVLADTTQLRQVVMNLVINASEAIGDKSGFIGITTGMTRADRAYLAGSSFAPDLPEGDYVFLEISDNGGGMAPEVQAKIFDPFFTTKFTGRGLGLAAVLGIVRGHKGTLKVFSEAGWGTTFKILLPCAEGPADLITKEGPALADWHGSGLVLVVDDEETVRVTTARMLEATGFETRLADNGRTGVEEFKALEGKVALVILDLTMPHMDGDEAFRAITAMDPKARVLLMSGFNEQDAIARFTGKGLAGFIQKPFTIAGLREKLQAIFAEPATIPAS